MVAPRGARSARIPGSPIISQEHAAGKCDTNRRKGPAETSGVRQFRRGRGSGPALDRRTRTWDNPDGDSRAVGPGSWVAAPRIAIEEAAPRGPRHGILAIGQDIPRDASGQRVPDPVRASLFRSPTYDRGGDVVSGGCGLWSLPARGHLLSVWRAPQGAACPGAWGGAGLAGVKEAGDGVRDDRRR